LIQLEFQEAGPRRKEEDVEEGLKKLFKLNLF